MTKLATIFTLLLIAAAAQSAFGQDARTDQQKFIDAVKFLEAQPLHEDAKKLRSWAMKYSEGVETKMCEKMLGLFMTPEVGGETMSQYLIAVAAFKLSDPDKKADENAAQLAALESALKVYEIASKEGAQVKIKKFEQLKTIRAGGKLAEFVKAAKCR